ncbi:hypothetical protein D3C80_1030580 [compost metagenome]
MIALGPEDAQHQVFENGAVLPRLAAMGERDETGRLELVGGGEQFIEGGRHLGPGLVEHLRVDPQPVDPVDVHRHRYIVAVVLHDLGDFLWQQGVPVVGSGDIVEFGEQAQRTPLLDVRPLDLGGAWRVTGHCAALQYGHGRCATATGDGVVLPGETVFLDLFLEGFHRRGFASGGPPVSDFDHAVSGSNSTQGQQGGEGNDSGEAIDRIHREEPFLVVMQVQVVVLALALESNQRHPGRR